MKPLRALPPSPGMSALPMTAIGASSRCIQMSCLKLSIMNLRKFWKPIKKKTITVSIQNFQLMTGRRLLPGTKMLYKPSLAVPFRKTRKNNSGVRSVRSFRPGVMIVQIPIADYTISQRVGAQRSMFKQWFSAIWGRRLRRVLPLRETPQQARMNIMAST